MRLHRLDVTAFGPFGGSQTVDFDALSLAGLFLLHGPTGAGKTSVLDAVCYALYGSVPGARQSGQGMTLRSDHAAAGTRTEVRLELTVAGRRLEVTRQPPWERPKKRGSGTTLDKAQTWLREYDVQAGSWKDLSRSHQEIGEEITQLLGMSREQFCQVVLLPQGDFARFLRADAEARGKLLGRLFDTHRFAEVEKRLAERRRAAEAQVRDGDAALLADAHRMQQAAGNAMQLPPDLAPGEPGLAEAILGAAAIARSTAREQLTGAHCRLLAAESAQAAADRALADVREVARLQGRFAEARERAALLEERADGYRQAQVRMERSRKAEAVAPALELRDAAEAEHRRAAAAEARARVLLPETFAGPAPPGSRSPRAGRPRNWADWSRRVAVSSDWPNSSTSATSWTVRSGPTRACYRTPRTGSPVGRTAAPHSRPGSTPLRTPRPGPSSSPYSVSPRSSGSVPRGCGTSSPGTRTPPPNRPGSPRNRCSTPRRTGSTSRNSG